MAKYNLLQSVKTLEKMFNAGIDTEKKIRKLQWSDLKNYTPIEKSFIMDLKDAITKRKIIEFLAGKEDEKSNYNIDTLGGA